MSDFSDTIERLWNALGLSRSARLSSEPTVSLSFDDATVEFLEAQDGRRLILRSVVAPLAPDAAARERQIRDILRINLAHLHNCRAGAVVETTQTNDRTLIVEAAYAYASRDIGALGRLVEDVLRLREAHLASIVGEAPRRTKPMSMEEGGSMVFRP